jgi:hypothetical protein
MIRNYSAIACQRRESARLLAQAARAATAHQIHATLGSRDMPGSIRSLPSSLQMAPLVAAWDSANALPARIEREQTDRQRAAAAVIHAVGQLAPRHAEHILQVIWDRASPRPNSGQRDGITGAMERAVNALPQGLGDSLKAQFSRQQRQGLSFEAR